MKIQLKNCSRTFNFFTQFTLIQADHSERNTENKQKGFIATDHSCVVYTLALLPHKANYF